MQEAAVFLIIVAALGFTVRNIYRKFTAKEQQCGCDCGSCGQSEKCDERT